MMNHWQPNKVIATLANTNVRSISYPFTRIVLYVHGKNVITDITLNDGEWHFICATWTSTNGRYDIYVDGVSRDAGHSLSTNLLVEANGTIIVGQEQVRTPVQIISVSTKCFTSCHFRTVSEVASAIRNHLSGASLTRTFGIDELVPMKCSNFIQHASHTKEIYTRGRISEHKSMVQ